MLHYFSQLNDAGQQSIVQMIQVFLSEQDEKVATVSIEAYNRQLEESDAEIEAGNYVPHEEVMRRCLRVIIMEVRIKWSQTAIR